MTCVDPGASLIEIARAKFAGSESVRFEVASFEEWPSFDDSVRQRRRMA